MRYPRSDCLILRTSEWLWNTDAWAAPSSITVLSFDSPMLISFYSTTTVITLDINIIGSTATSFDSLSDFKSGAQDKKVAKTAES